MARVVVVTGATSGVGRACVRAFADDGADVAVLARDGDALAKVVEEVRGRGRRAHAIAVDVADAEAVDRAADEVERELGPIDVWVNSAMTSVFSPVSRMTPEEFRRVVEVTCLGSVYGAMAAVRRMRERNSGHVLQIGSALAFRGIPLQSAYCTAKHGVNGFYDSLRSELIHDGSDVRVSLLHLPAINTPQFRMVRNKLGHHGQPVPPIFQPEVAADAAVWLSHHPKRRELWLAWSTVKTIWGGRLLPSFADWYLARKAYDAQMTDEPWSADAPDYLFTPLPGDPGAHGEFGDMAKERSTQVVLAKHRGLVAAALGVGGSIAALAARRAG